MGAMRVLLVHDQAIMLDGFRALLRAYDDIEIVGEAGDGHHALEKARQVAPDIVIMDIASAGVAGLEIVGRLAEKDIGARVLLLIEQNNVEQMVSALRAGAAGCLSKGAHGDELIAAMRCVHRGEAFVDPSLVTDLVADYRTQVLGRDRREPLTPREKEVLQLVAGGDSSREIVAKLHISLKTVQVHRARIMTKLNIHNRADLIKYAIRHGLASLD
jgi:DNA-binding NarL/FixJ family response regulator